MKSTITVLAFLFAMLSYRLLFGDGSVQELSRLNDEFGMIGNDETFYQFLGSTPKSGFVAEPGSR